MEFVNHPVEWKSPGVEPPNDLKDTGFTAGYKPPAGYFNYLFHVAYLVAKELQEKFQDYPDDFLQALEGKADKNHSHDLATENNDGFMSKEMVTKLAELIASGGGGVDDYLQLKNIPNLEIYYDQVYERYRPHDVSMRRGGTFIIARGGDRPTVEPPLTDPYFNYGGNGLAITTRIFDNKRMGGGYKKSFIILGDPTFLKYNQVIDGLFIGQNVFGANKADEIYGDIVRSALIGATEIDGDIIHSLIVGGRIMGSETNYDSTVPIYIHGKVTSSIIFGREKDSSKGGNIPKGCSVYYSLIGGESQNLGNADTRIAKNVYNSLLIGVNCGYNTASYTGSNGQAAYYDDQISSGAALGSGCLIQSFNSFAMGEGLNSSENNFVIGTYNKNPVPRQDMLTVGNGGSNEKRSNAFRVTKAGQVYGTSSFNSTGADYAEMFEWLDGNPYGEDRRGLFVTLDGEKVRPASSEDDYILGVVSAAPSVVGDNFADDWNGKYLCDVYGQRLLQDVEVPDELDDEGNVRIPAHVEKRWILNPDFNPEQDNMYIPRDQRPEWAAVGMMGKLIVRDDGSCQVNGFCMPGENGIATSSKTGFRVMKRLDETHVKILLK